ncbi:hypothetical protein PF005_g18627 [Phytophthora fragariae]|uniref:Secreted protein n=1 Tax=Phytophthora fragariae TaxID=53985 RepID=A0A6A3WWL9_9STRA|nr:hypothetical protein PF005_g18627 [Phytophthora fragariae]KAE9228834.1 hypothetical protein PF004_g10970 [Phytophthora fragariae]
MLWQHCGLCTLMLSTRCQAPPLFRRFMPCAICTKLSSASSSKTFPTGPRVETWRHVRVACSPAILQSTSASSRVSSVTPFTVLYIGSRGRARPTRGPSARRLHAANLLPLGPQGFNERSRQ